MKEAIKLVLVYFACQIVGAILAMIPCAIIALVLYKDFSLVQDMMLAPSMLVGFGLMTFYLFRKKYIPFDLQSWSAISASYLSSVILLTFSVMFLIDWLMSHLTFLPNWLDASFDVLSSNWLGDSFRKRAWSHFGRASFSGCYHKNPIEEIQTGKSDYSFRIDFRDFSLKPCSGCRCCSGRFCFCLDVL